MEDEIRVLHDQPHHEMQKMSIVNDQQTLTKPHKKQRCRRREQKRAENINENEDRRMRKEFISVNIHCFKGPQTKNSA